MTRQRITPVAVLLAAVLAMGTGIAKAQETVRIAALHTVTISPTATDRVIVTAITVPARTFDSVCMSNAGFGGLHEGGTVVIVDNRTPPGATLGTLYYSEPLAPGTRLVNLSFEASCLEPDGTYNVYEAEIANPKNLNMAFVATPAGVTLAEDHEAVVGAGTDELGIADAVCVKKGSQSVKTEIISDLPLEPGDRLTDFLELDFDFETGETTYACWLEY